MKKRILKALKITLKVVLGLVAFVVLYILCALGFSRIPVHKNYKNVSNGIEIYILTNGVHTDVVLPIRNSYKDWSREINPGKTLSKDTSMNYASFGWGDKGFYLDTPTWGDLKFSTAFKAAFYLGSSAMHVTFYKEMTEDATCKKIRISRENYQRLVHYIEESFKKDEKGNIQHIPNHSYADNDSFYEAKGKYSLFFTCNTWTNEALKYSNLKSCLWTPLDKGIFYHYK